jgi:hypothetical protein
MDPKVFCVGMFKTGTTSMGRALEILGYHTLNGPWWPNGIMLADPWYERPEEWKRYDAVIRSQAEKYDAFQDYPWMYCFKECDRWFPGSKFILTLRDPDQVAESDIRMWRKVNVPADQIPPRSKFISRYNAHYESVARYFAGRNDLLTINITAGVGWREICEFLDKPLPEKEFPHLNQGHATPRRSVLCRALDTIRRPRGS